MEGTALDVLTDPHLLEAFRYLAAPPISQDDLKVLAEASSLAKGRLQSKPEDVRRLIEVVRLVLDRRRFSWVVENREPTEAERGAAVMASAALMAASRVQTKRRTLGKEQQEALVKQALKELGLKEVPAREIPTVALAPAASRREAGRDAQPGDDLASPKNRLGARMPQPASCLAALMLFA